MRLLVTVAAVAGVFSISSAIAQTQSVCQQNYTVEGTPGLSNMNFRSWREFPNLDQQKALKNLRAAMLAEGMENVGVDAEAGALTAVRDATGTGRVQTWRVSARRIGNGTRVDAVYQIQVRQMANSNEVRSMMCRIIDSANL